MKNKKSLKNLKQFRVKSKFVFYVVFRPKAQQWFFPIIGLILFASILHYEATKEYVFTNPKLTAVEAVAEVSETLEKDSPVTSGTNDPTVVKTNSQGGDSLTPQAQVIQQVAEKENIDWKVLYALCVKESNCNGDRVGDSGQSYGYFQIHQKYHPGTIQCAKDLKCSAEWTAKRLKRHAGLGEWKMIQSHNGLLANNANAYYVEDIYQIIKSL